MNSQLADSPWDMGDIVAGAFGIYRRAPWRWLGLTVATLVAGFGLQYLLSTQVDFNKEPTSDEVDAVWGWYMLTLGGLALAEVFTQTAIVAASGNQIAGRGFSVGGTYLTAVRRFLPVLAASVIAFVVLVLLAVLILTIPLAIFFFVGWSFFTQAIVIEGDGVMASLRRSRAIVARQWWRTFGISLAILLLAVLPSIVIGRATAPFSADWVAALGAAVAAGVAAPFRGLAQTLLYVDLRRRKGEKPFSEPTPEAS